MFYFTKDSRSSVWRFLAKRRLLRNIRRSSTPNWSGTRTCSCPMLWTISRSYSVPASHDLSILGVSRIAKNGAS